MATITGIDLGTTFSAIAILNGIGRPEIIPNSEGERITPSALYFDEENPSVVQVGVEAVNSRLLNPERAVRWIKRHIGTDYKVKIDGREWTPVELSSLILRKLAQDAAAQVGSIDNVAISVPAHFDEIRRKATMDAGALAGLNVISIVNEPVAAALYYATKQDVSGRVLVYDLGGGTFDVTLMDINGRDMEILCSQGDHALGGIDFDRSILEIFKNNYRDQCNEDLIASDVDLAKYEDEAEDTKKTLSRRDIAKKILYGPTGSARAEITRPEFEQAIASLLARTEMLIDSVLSEAGCTKKDIDRVLLVGGSTRIPMVSQKLEEMFGFPPENSVNVDECVALGAAIHAGLTTIRQKPESVSEGIAGGLRDVKLQDVCNHSYGTLSAPFDKETGQHILINTPILHKNTPLPCEETLTFYTMVDDQEHVRITITQGEDTDPAFVNVLTNETFKLPPGTPAGTPISATYSYDLNQRMHCRFTNYNSGETLDVEFNMGENGDASANNIQKQTEELARFETR